MRQHRCSILCGSKVGLLALASIGILTGIALSKGEIYLFVTEHVLPAGPCSMLHGFAPLIGVVVLNGILIRLLFRLVCKAENTILFAEEDSTPQADTTKRWILLTPYSILFTANYLSLKEHSPPKYLPFPA